MQSMHLNEQVRFRFYDYTEPADFLLDLHLELEIGIVCSGVMQRQYKGWNANLGPGQIWICGMLEPHSCALIQLPCRVFVAMLSPQLATGLGEYFSKPFSLFWVPPSQRPQAQGTECEEVLGRVAGIERDMNAGHDGIETKALHTLEFLTMLQRKGVATGRERAPNMESYYRIGPGLQMAINSRVFIPVEDAAAACAMSRNTFASLFGKIMGKPFAEFALGHRLRSAVTELVRTREAPKEIAQRWGFTDLAHFHHCFRKVYGCTPGEYRQRAQYRILPE